MNEYYLTCSACGFQESSEEKFVGIFTVGQSFQTTENLTCCLYGCPKCGTIKYVTNLQYIHRRKKEYRSYYRRPDYGIEVSITLVDGRKVEATRRRTKLYKDICWIYEDKYGNEYKPEEVLSWDYKS